MNQKIPSLQAQELIIDIFFKESPKTADILTLPTFILWLQYLSMF